MTGWEPIARRAAMRGAASIQIVGLGVLLLLSAGVVALGAFHALGSDPRELREQVKAAIIEGFREGTPAAGRPLRQAVTRLGDASRARSLESADYAELLAAFPLPAPSWSREDLVTTAEAVALVLQEGRLDATLLVRAARILRAVRHVLVLEDLRHGGGAAPDRRHDALGAIRPFMVSLRNLLSERLPASSPQDLAPFTEQEHALIEELAGYEFLCGRFDDAAVMLGLPLSGPPAEPRPRESEGLLVRRYRQLSALAACRLGPDAAAAVGAELERLTRAGAGNVKLELTLTSIREYDQGSTSRAWLLPRRALYESGIEDLAMAPDAATRSGIALESLLVLPDVRLRVLLYLKGRVQAAGSGPVRAEGTAAMAGGAGRVRVLINLARRYLEAGKREEVQALRQSIARESPHDLSQYGAALIDAALAGDSVQLGRLLAAPQGRTLAAPQAWEALAAGEAPRESYQRTLVGIAEDWDAIGQPSRLPALIQNLIEHTENEVHRAYILYVEALFFCAQRMWPEGLERLESLHAHNADYRRLHGRDMPGLPLANAAALFSVAQRGSRARETGGAHMDEARIAFTRLASGAALLDDRAAVLEPLAAGGMDLARATLAGHRMASAAETVGVFLAAWNRLAANGDISLMLAREFIALVNAAGAALEQRVSAIRRAPDARAFQEGIALLERLRELVAGPSAYMDWERRLCEAEAERLKGLLADELNERTRARLTQEAGAHYLRAAEACEKARSAGAGSECDLGAWYMYAGRYDKAVEVFAQELKQAAFTADAVQAAFRLAQALMRARHYVRAVDVFGKYLTGYPGGELAAPLDLRYVYLQAVCYLELDRFEDADVLFEQVWEQATDVSTGLWQQAVYGRARGFYRRALADPAAGAAYMLQARDGFEELVRRFPEGVRIDDPPGSGIDLVERAIEGYAKALYFLIDAGGPAPRNAGRVSPRMFAAEQFRALAARILRKTPEDRLTHEQRRLVGRSLVSAADLYFDMARIPEAVGFYQKADHFLREGGDPLRVWTLFQLSRCQQALGRERDAAELLERCRRALALIGEDEVRATLAAEKAFWEQRFADSLRDLASDNG